MKEVIINWTYYYDKIACPSFVADNLETYQIKFDSWIGNTNSKHNYWINTDDGQLTLSFDTDAFVNWLNEYELVNNEEKAYFVKRNVEKNIFNRKFKLPTINF